MPKDKDSGKDNNNYYYYYYIMMMFHELLLKSMMMRLHVCCSVYGNDINRAITTISIIKLHR